MSPDKKYMPSQKDLSSNDLNLVPFKTPMTNSNMPIGWIPVFSFNKLNSEASPFMLPNLSNINNTSNNGNTASANINSQSNNENYPSSENIENLYSYNKTQSSPNRESENISDVISNYFTNLDENTDLCRKCSDKRIDKIYAKIQEKDPEIISMLIDNYKIPCPIAKAAIRKIIKLSLHYCKKAGD